MKLGRPSLRIAEDPNPNSPDAGGTSGGLAPTACPPGYTPATVAGATPGSCTDPAGHVVSPDAFYLEKNVDSRYSAAQWQTWINLGKYDPKTHMFRSERTGPNGEVLDAWVAKPVDCPDGMTAFGGGRCLDEGDPRLTGGSIGGPAPATGADGLLTSHPTPEVNPKSDLQLALEQQFLGRQGVFGQADTSNPAAGKSTKDLFAKPLTGGGLWWGDNKGMFDNNLSPKPLDQGFTPAKPPINTLPKIDGGVATGTPLTEALLQKYHPQVPWWKMGAA